MRQTLLTVFMGWISLALSAQSANPFFYKIFADYGLSSDKATTTIQDHMGFLWIGTEEGLNRMIGHSNFDTYKFKRSDSTTISNDYITTLFQDSRNRLWIGTKNGLNLFNREHHTFSRVRIEHNAPHMGGMVIHDMIEDTNGHFWLICGRHLVHLNGNTLEVKGSFEVSKGDMENLNLNALLIFQSKVWVGTSKGLFVLDNGRLTASEIVPPIEVTSLLNFDNELWVGTSGYGLVRFNPATKGKRIYKKEGQESITSDYINHIAQVDEHELWVSTADGVSVFNLKEGTLDLFKHDFNDPFSLSDKIVREVYQDRLGVVWVTTPNSGINYYHDADNLFGYVGQSTSTGTDKDLMDYAVFSILQGRDHKIWLGSRKGVSSLDLITDRFDHYPLPERWKDQVTSVFSVAQCSANNLWLGTDNGLVRWSMGTESYSYITPTRLNGVEIRTVMADDQDNLWLGTTNEGVKLYSSISKILVDVPFKKEESAASAIPEINHIYELNDKRILAATDLGLYVFEDGAFERVEFEGFDEKIPDKIMVNVLHQDLHGHIWMGTQQDGALKMDGTFKAIKQYEASDGLVSNDIRSIVEDNRGDLWLSTNEGISKLRVDNGQSIIRNYDISDGLQSDQFLKGSGIRAEDNRIFIGGLNGLTLFDPKDIIHHEVIQTPRFTGLLINGEEVKIGADGSPLTKDIGLVEKLVLDCEQSNFTLSFDALDYVRPNHVEYRYKLLGYDNNWIVKKGLGVASYQNLPVGETYDFVFQSKGRFSDWSAERHLSIYIEPHFYQTTWFKVLIVVGLLSLISFIFWFLEKRSIKKRQELEGLVKERSSELRKEIEERKKVEDRLRGALVQAEDANAIKNRFLANMSHEIRTPLNGILGLAQLSQEGDMDAEQRDIMNTISNSANSLKSIVDDILDITKIESGSMEMDIRPFNVKELMREVTASFKTAAEDKGLSIKHWILPTVPECLEGDEQHLRQVLVNLVSNAIKFTHSGGVTLFVECLGEEELELWITVSDTGIGISEGHQESIFESFTQVDTADTRKYGGTGLGLSICKELVDKMNGEIWVESKEGEGSIFKFYVKLKVCKHEVLEYVNETGGPGQQITGDVLLVEDNITNQKVASKMLLNKGMKVTCAENGEVAINLVKQLDFDLILMDLQMPVMDGYEATRTIRSMKGQKGEVPIVALTAAAMNGEREKCLAAGMNDYLSKPVDYNLLIQTVRSYLDDPHKFELESV